MVMLHACHDPAQGSPGRSLRTSWEVRRGTPRMSREVPQDLLGGPQRTSQDVPRGHPGRTAQTSREVREDHSEVWEVLTRRGRWTSDLPKLHVTTRGRSQGNHPEEVVGLENSLKPSVIQTSPQRSSTGSHSIQVIIVDIHNSFIHSKRRFDYKCCLQAPATGSTQTQRKSIRRGPSITPQVIGWRARPN